MKQARFSKCVKFFREGFLKKWQLEDYNDPDAPCFFAGVYGKDDVDIINNHNGLAVVWNTRWNDKIRELFKGINPENVVVCIGMGVPFDLEGYRYKHVSFPIKDFSMFTPNPLGGSVYCYINSEKRKHKYGYETIEAIKKRIEYPVIYGLLGHEMGYVKSRYYDNCFVNIKLDAIGGMTTSTELALMGRRSISKANTPFCDQHKTTDDIVRLINKEAKKIGTVQPSQIGEFFNTGKEWTNKNFWI